MLTKQLRAMFVHAWRVLSALVLATGMLVVVQSLTPATASAGIIPPPVACGQGPTYQFQDPSCWGNAGNPPSGCLNANAVSNTEPCLVWKAKLPAAADIGTPLSCPNNEVVGAGQICCLRTDTTCLNGTITTPQGDPASLALAVKVCQEIKDVKNANVAQIPAQCALPQPTLQAGLQTCNVAEQANPLANDSSQIWKDCSQLVIDSSGEVAPTRGPDADDPALAKSICALISGNSQVTQTLVPKGCSGTPSVVDGVAACKVFIQSDLSSSQLGQAIEPKCFDLLIRNPANQAVTTPIAPPPVVAATFNDSNMKTLTSGLTYFALIFSLGGMFLSCALWAIGSKGQNEGQQHTGKRGLIACLLAAFLIGALPSIFTFFDGASHKVDDTGITASN